MWASRRATRWRLPNRRRLGRVGEVDGSPRRRPAVGAAGLRRRRGRRRPRRSSGGSCSRGRVAVGSAPDASSVTIFDRVPPVPGTGPARSPRRAEFGGLGDAEGFGVVLRYWSGRLAAHRALAGGWAATSASSGGRPGRGVPLRSTPRRGPLSQDPTLDESRRSASAHLVADSPTGRRATKTAPRRTARPAGPAAPAPPSRAASRLLDIQLIVEIEPISGLITDHRGVGEPDRSPDKYVRIERDRPVRGDTVGPQRVDESIRGDGVSAMDHEECQQPTLLRTADVQESPLRSARRDQGP